MQQNRFLLKLLAITVLFYGCSKSSTPDVTPAPPVVISDTDNLVFIGAANKKMYAVDADKGTKVWEYATLGQIFSSPTVDNEVVYFGSDSLVYGLEAKTGTSKWLYDKNVKKSFIQASPLVVNGNIYFGTYTYASGFLNLDFFKGISITDKQIKVSRVITNSNGSAGIISSATYSNGSLFFGSYDKNIYAVSEDGAKIWSYTTRGAIYSSPVVKSGVLYVGGLDGYFYAIDAVTGSLKWETNVKSDIDASPVEKDGIIYFASLEGKVYALNASNGSIKWQTQIGASILSSPAISGNTLIIGGGLDKNLVCLNLSDGSSNWKTPLSSATASSPTVSNGNVYIGDNGGNLYSINATTGVIKWTFASASVFNVSSPCVLTTQGKTAVSSINGAN